MSIQNELELTFPTHTITKPVLCDMARDTGVVFNIISANVSQHRGRFHLLLVGDEAQVMAAQRYLRDAGIGVDLVSTKPYKAPLPVPPARVESDPGEAKLSKKLWVTF